jgi:hypothetical protein
VEGLDVHKLLHDVVLKQDAISSTEVAGHGTDFSCRLRAVGLDSSDSANGDVAFIELC